MMKLVGANTYWTYSTIHNNHKIGRVVLTPVPPPFGCKGTPLATKIILGSEMWRPILWIKKKKFVDFKNKFL